MNTFHYLMHCPCIVYHTEHFIKTDFLKVLNYALDTMCWDKYITFETNNLIQSNGLVFLLMQNYSHAFFQTECDFLQSYLLFPGGHCTLTIEMYKKKER